MKYKNLIKATSILALWITAMAGVTNGYYGPEMFVVTNVFNFIFTLMILAYVHEQS